MAVTVLGLAGSPRRRGNTETLLDWTLSAAEEAGARVVKYRLRDLDINGCRACDACFKDGNCVVKDGMQELYPYLRTAGSVVLAAPIFSMGMCAQAKAMVDRCQPFWATKYILGRKVTPEGVPQRLGAYLCAAGSSGEDVFDGARQVVRYFWHVLEVESTGEILAPGVDTKGEIEQQSGVREAALDLGRRLAGSSG